MNMPKTMAKKAISRFGSMRSAAGAAIGIAPAVAVAAI